MAFTRRVWSAGRFLLLLAALVTTFALAFAVSMRVAMRTREVKVPELSGRSVNEASQYLADLGLTLRVEEARRVDALVQVGRVVAQDPPGGVTARRPRSVKVWLSAGAAAETVPALTGQPERTAQLLAQQASLRLDGLAEIRSAAYAAGTVVAQNPAPDARAGSVQLLVNREVPAGGFVMPDLIGLRGEQAAGVLRVRGFRVSVSEGQPYPGVPAGTVIRQSPRGGFEVGPADSISIEVST